MSELELNYRVIGEGPPLLLVHGFGISFNIWEFILPVLRPHFSVIMVELPGIGRSPLLGREHPYLDQVAAGLENVRTSLGIERWQILSYSSGTRAAEKYIQLHPACVESAVFLCPAQISVTKVLGLRIAIQLDRLIPQFGNWVLSGSRLKFLIDLLGFNYKKNDLSDKWFTEISAQPVEVLKETLRSFPVQKGQSFCIPDGIPVSFIWGNADLIADAPRKLSPLQDYVIRAFHSAPQTSAQQVSDTMLPFLLASHQSS